MPPLESMDLEDTALYWERIGTDRNGNPTYDSPIAIDVRWEEHPTVLRGPEGQPIMVQVQLVFDFYPPLGSLLYYGDLDSWLGTGSAPPLVEPVLYQLVTRDNGRDLKGRNERYTGGANPFRGKIPDVS